MNIRVDDLTGPEVIALLLEHLRCMEVSPPESRHALNLDQLRRPEITFWTAWEGAELMLQHIITEARQRSYCRLSLESGSMKYFEPAHRLYAKFGFINCAPFAGYINDPNSVFMTKEL